MEEADLKMLCQVHLSKEGREKQSYRTFHLGWVPFCLIYQLLAVTAWLIFAIQEV